MKSTRRSADSETPSLDISSLVDVSFLLLIFFLVTSTIQRSEADLSSKLVPDSPSPTTATPPYPIDISLDVVGTIHVDGEAVDQPGNPAGAPSLVQHLREISQLASMTDSVCLAIIDAADDAPHQRLVDILDALTETDIGTITLSGFQD